MPSVILTINAGSSSLKSQLFIHRQDKPCSLARAEVSSINQQPATLKYTSSGKDQKTELDNVSDHKAAFERILDAFLSDQAIKEVSSKQDIDYVCHRVVQGGDFTDDQLITKETFHKIEALEDLAPLHNKSAVDLMIACHEHLPDVKNVACFDSAFHSAMPEEVRTYMIDQETAKSKGLRKYGFHGLSYGYITRVTAQHLKKPRDQLNIIALHLGSGASICAIRRGQSIDTSMGLTPVSGLPGGTRSGDIDPALIFHYTSEASRLSLSSTKELHISTAEEILNKKSGWKAITGTTDFAEIAKHDAPETHQLALRIFVDRIVGYIGNYYVKLGGKVDAIVFAGGIGEKSSYLRKLVIAKVSCLGFGIDEKANNEPRVTDAIAEVGEHHGTKTLMCLTDEDVRQSVQQVAFWLILSSTKWHITP